MRVLLTALTCPKGELEVNFERHLALLRTGAERGCDLVLLPEMSLTGYRPSAAVTLDDPVVARFVAATAQGTAACFGIVEQAPTGLPFITQLVAAEGDLTVVHRKAHLGQDEDVDFQPGQAAGVFEIAGVTCSLAVCAEIGTAPPYEKRSQVVLGPSAPGLYGERRSNDESWRSGFDWWRGSVADDARRLLGPDQLLAVSTQAGATDDEDFPGWACVVDATGRPLAELPDWREGELVVELAR